MKEKEFDAMRQQRREMLSESEKKQQSPIIALLNKRLVTIKKEEKNPSIDGKQKDEKSAIWWMITIFCLVYGFQILYEALNAPIVTP